MSFSKKNKTINKAHHQHHLPRSYVLHCDLHPSQRRPSCQQGLTYTRTYTCISMYTRTRTSRHTTHSHAHGAMLFPPPCDSTASPRRAHLGARQAAPGRHQAATGRHRLLSRLRPVAPTCCLSCAFSPRTITIPIGILQEITVSSLRVSRWRNTPPTWRGRAESGGRAEGTARTASWGDGGRGVWDETW